nr:TfuA-like protein [uncultured Rhodoferax sp.]
MQYNPQTPIAVFLGPSLARHKAERLLPANYYPPVRMGDVYRLIATGVQTIVIIDGVFHNTTPVWQRELVAAMDSGITVIGAASMGALRAAELDQLGMVGVGKIYEWYRDGVVDGDDEVALLHADEALGYQAISEPLVNIRYTLDQAVERAILNASQATTLLDLAKSRFFGDRSYHLLLQSPLVKDLPSTQRCDLTDLLTEKPVNLKQDDAIAVLRYCAALADTKPVPPAQTISLFPRPVVDTAYPAFETLKRGILTSSGALLDIQALFEMLKQDADLMAVEHARCAGMFYLSELAVALGLSAPKAFLSEFHAHWTATHVVGEQTLWLRQVGLTQREFDQLVRARATQAYLLQQTPESLGFAYTDQRVAVEALAQWYTQASSSPIDKAALLAQEHADLSARAVAGCLATNWAESLGICAPEDVIEQFIARWEQREAIESRERFLKTVGLTDQQFRLVWSQQAMYQWMLEMGPTYFGYGTYSFPKALMEDMQVTGAVRALSTHSQQEASP